jgi:hypothetical protein
MDELIVTVRSSKDQSLKLHALIASGADVRQALDSGPMSELRQSLTESMKLFEDARHESRRSLVAAGLKEGMTIRDFSRAWGISRQLAARYAHEVRTDCKD